MGTNASMQELHHLLISLNQIHAQHLQVPNYLLHQKSLALLNASGFQAKCIEQAEPKVKRDGKNELHVALSLCLLSQSLQQLTRQSFF